MIFSYYGKTHRIMIPLSQTGENLVCDRSLIMFIGEDSDIGVIRIGPNHGLSGDEYTDFDQMKIWGAIKLPILKRTIIEAILSRLEK